MRGGGVWEKWAAPGLGDMDARYIIYVINWMLELATASPNSVKTCVWKFATSEFWECAETQRLGNGHLKPRPARSPNLRPLLGRRSAARRRIHVRAQVSSSSSSI